MSDYNNLVSELQDDIDEVDQQKQDMIKWAENATNEEIEAAFKKINPYGVVIPDNEINLEHTDADDMPSFSMSYTNYRMEFCQNYATCANIAFLFRMLIEYEVPAEVPTFEIEDFMNDPTIADPPAMITDERLLRLYAENKEAMAERVVIYKFLKSVYGYDPDKHVRSSYKSNKKDPSRRRPKTKEAKRAVDSRNCIRKEPVHDYEGTSADQDYDVKNDCPVEKECFNTIPAVEYFTRVNRFRDEHHEPLLQVTKDLYGSDPDVDFAICIYDKHKNKKEGKEFRVAHEKDVIASIINIDQNRWAMLGPYRQNRQKVELYNSHTEVLKQMADKREQDEPIATDIMKKQVKNKKAANIAEAGPDDPGFRKWVRENKPDIARMGATHITDDVDDDKKSGDHDDQVEVNVFNLQDGGRTMKVHKIYNPVEAPVGMPDDSAHPGTMGLAGSNPPQSERGSDSKGNLDNSKLGSDLKGNSR